MKPLQDLLRRFSDNSSDLGRALRNTTWVSGERAIRLVISLLVTSIIARYLGPESFGLLSLGLAIIAISMPLTELGLQGVMIKAHVEDPDNSSCLTGTCLAMRCIGALATTLLAISIARLLPQENTRLVTIVMILAIIALCRAVSDTFKHPFEAKLNAKPTIIAEFFSAISASLLKVIAATCGASLFAIAAIQSAESVFLTLALFVIYPKFFGRIRKLSFSSAKASQLARRGWPLMLSSIAVIIYMKIDQIMLGVMLGEEEVGIYTIATRISEVWYFIPAAVLWSTFPLLVEVKKKDPMHYARRMTRLFRTMVLLAAGAALIINLCSGIVVHLLFGDQYATASTILSVHAWGGVFATLSMVTRYWAINEGLQHLELARTISGAALNVLLNLWLIPSYGIMGAAVATLLSHFWAGFLFDLTHPSTHRLFHRKMKAFLFWTPA